MKSEPISKQIRSYRGA